MANGVRLNNLSLSQFQTFSFLQTYEEYVKYMTETQSQYPGYPPVMYPTATYPIMYDPNAVYPIGYDSHSMHTGAYVDPTNMYPTQSTVNPSEVIRKEDA